MLKERIFSAAILLFIFSASFFSKNPSYFLFLVFVLSVILFYELGKILKLKSLSLIIYWILSFAPIIFFYLIISLNINFLDVPNHHLNNFLNIFTILISFISLIFWAVLAPIDIKYKKISSNVKFKIFYGYFLITPMAIATSLIFIQNKAILLIPFIMIWVADIGAYFIGKNFGKNRLAKSISPGKTIEGALGGFVCNIICAYILAYFSEVDFYIMLFFALMVTTLSIFGDIYESFLKRQANVKDSGSIIPGHGGLLDRLDSFCPTLPLFYLANICFNSFIPTKLLL